jgi:TonB family protein
MGIAAALLLLVAPAPAPQPQSLWQVDWANVRCSLVRDMPGAAPDLALRIVPGAPRPEVWIIGSGWTAKSVSKAEKVELILGPGGMRTEGFQYVAMPNGGGYALGLKAAAPDFLKAFEGASTASLRQKGKLLADWALPDARKAIAALRECEDDMLREWGIDPLVARSLREPPEPVGGSVASWFSDADYPGSSISEREQGTSWMRIKIRPDGGIAECRTVIGSGFERLDKAACSIVMKRGHYKPAIGPDGVPVEALVVSSITWRLPEG